MIQGKVSDPEGVRRQFDRWTSELRSGATGFLGGTGGLTEDGQCFLAARFESPEAAQTNSERPEQSEWWAETEKYFDGPVDFTDTTDIDVQLEPSNDAKFVQIIQSRVLDRPKVEELTPKFIAAAGDRPDVVGALTIWSGDRATDLIYFTSEADARAAEQKEQPDMQPLMEELQAAIDPDVKYLDLKDPWIT